jgi:hypothetical protein
MAEEVKLLQKLDLGVTHLMEKYGVGTTTICDLKKLKDKLLEFYYESNKQKLMENIKTMHKARNYELDCVMIKSGFVSARVNICHLMACLS